MLGNFSCSCCRLLTFFQSNFFKRLLRTLSECQMVWIQIRTDQPSVIQTVYKGYQQTIKVAASKERVNTLYLILPLFFFLKMLPAFYICCIYSSAPQTKFYHQSKHYEPWSDSSPDLGPYCLQYMLPKREKTTKVVTGGERA